MFYGLKRRMDSILKRSLIVCHDNDRKSYRRIFIEFIIASIKSKTVATHYFTSFLYKNTVQDYLSHISHKEGRYLQRMLCDKDTFAIQGNKLLFHFFFENADFPLADLLAYNIREKLIVKIGEVWKAYEVNTLSNFEKVLKIIIDQSSSGHVFIKLSSGSEGSGTIKISMQDAAEYKSLIAKYYPDIISNSYIFENAVNQHKELDIINNTTLNTIRIDTFKSFGGKPEIISAYLRIGRKSSFVDNLAAGGYRVGIDFETGRLNEFATTKITTGNSFVTHHADTGVKFHGIRIPYFSEVKEIVLEANRFLPQSLIGWDIGISENGPVIIECNSIYYDMVGADIAYGGYKRNPRYQRVCDYVRSEFKRAG